MSRTLPGCAGRGNLGFPSDRAHNHGRWRSSALRLCRRLLEQQFDAHPVRIMEIHGRAIPALLGSFADVEPGPLQVRNDIVKRRRLYLETEVVDPGVLLSGRSVLGSRYEVDPLASHLHHGRPPTVG